MQTYLEKLQARVRYYESKDENITTNAERENLAWAKRALAEYETFLRENPSQNPSKLRTAIDDAVTYAGNRQAEWGERAEHCFWILEQAVEASDGSPLTAKYDERSDSPSRIRKVSHENRR